MAENTLSPVGFDSSKIVKTHLDPQERFAMACMFGNTQDTVPQAAFVRYVLTAGIEALGWTEDRRIKEYAAYRLKCLRDGKPNLFESE